MPLRDDFAVLSEDPGFLKTLGVGLYDTVFGIPAGAGSWLADKFGLEGISERLGSFADERLRRREEVLLDYLSQDPSNPLRQGLGFISQLGAEVGPVPGAGSLAKSLTKSALRRGLPVGSAHVARALTEGAIEGGVTGLSVNRDSDDALLGALSGTALGALAGGGLSAATARAAGGRAAGRLSDDVATAEEIRALRDLDAEEPTAEPNLQAETAGDLEESERLIRQLSDLTDDPEAEKLHYNIRDKELSFEDFGEGGWADEALYYALKRVSNDPVTMKLLSDPNAIRVGLEKENRALARSGSPQRRATTPADFIGWRGGSATWRELGLLGAYLKKYGREARAGSESAKRMYGELMRADMEIRGEAGRALVSLQHTVSALDPKDARRMILARKFKIKDEKGLEELAMLDPENPLDVANFLRSRASTMDKITAYWYASVLSGVQTQVRNFIGGLTYGATDALFVKPTRVALDFVNHLFNPEVRRTEHVDEVIPGVTSWLKGLKDGFGEDLNHYMRWGVQPAKARYIPMEKFVSGISPTAGIDSKAAFDFRSDMEFGERLLTLATMPTRLMSGVDAAFKRAAFDRRLTTNAIRESHRIADQLSESANLKGDALDSVRNMVEKVMLEGDDDAAEAMLKEIGDRVGPQYRDQVAAARFNSNAAARQYALEATFQDQMSGPGRAIKGLQRSMPLAGRAIFPFVQVADRLFVRGFGEYSGIGFVRGINQIRKVNRHSRELVEKLTNTPSGTKEYTELQKALEKLEGTEKARAMELAARGTVGVAAMAALLYSYTKGNVTGEPPKDPTQREAWYRGGRQSQSIRIGGSWVPFNQLEPVSPALTAVVGAIDAAVNGEDGEKLNKAFEAGVRAMIDRSYLTGLRDMMDMATGRSRRSSFGKVLGRPLSGFMPYSGFGSSLANIKDPTIREPQKHTGDSLIDDLISEFQGRIPYAKDQMPSRLDSFGDEVVSGGTGSPFFHKAMEAWSPGSSSRLRATMPSGTPFAATKERSNPFDEVLQSADVGYGGTSLKEINGISLSEDQQRSLQKLTGSMVKQALIEVRLTGDYYNPLKREKAVRKAINKARRRARQMYSRVIGLG